MCGCPVHHLFDQEMEGDQVCTCVYGISGSGPQGSGDMEAGLSLNMFQFINETLCALCMAILWDKEEISCIKHPWYSNGDVEASHILS